MKTAFKILGIILVVLVAALFILPYAFRDQIETAIKEEVNNMVDAKVDYSDFSLSIFSSFPDLRVGMDDVSVVGKDRFDGDTLAYIGSFKADVKILPLLDGLVSVGSVIIDRPVVRGIVAADSIANWDIYKSEPDTIEEVADTTAAPMTIDLNKVVISDADIKYIDSTMNLMAHISDLDLNLSGKMVGDIFNTDLELDIASIKVVMDKITYVKNATLDFDANIEADLASSRYTMKENTLNFSGVPLAFDGFVQLNENSTSVDMRLAAQQTTFKSLLAVIPDYIMKDVEGLKMDGTFDLYADVKGDYIDLEHIPSVDAAFKVNNGQVKYPDLPKSLDNINIGLTIKNPGGSADLTTVNVDKFHFSLASNPFDATLNLVKPISNPTFKAIVNGVINLNSLKDALPLDSMNIGGIVKANLNVSTDMAAIEKEDYENIKAEGTVNLNDFNFDSNDFPQGVNISEAKLVFTPKFLQLDPLKATLGKSDFNAVGRVESYLPYVLSDGTIKGTLSLASNLIDCNELLSGESSEAAADTVVSSESAVIEIPSNIDFNLDTDIKKILYDNLTITNVKGGVLARNGIAKLYDLKMNLCEGSASLNGSYSAKNIEKPNIDMAIDLSDVDVNVLTNSFSTIDSLLPIAKSAHGKISISMNLVSDLDNQMSPVIKSMNGKGSFKSESLSLKESDFQKKLSTVLNNNKYNSLTMKSFKGSFNIADGSIVLTPFNVKLFDKSTTFSGQQGLDKTMDYLMSMPITRKELSSIVSKIGISVPSSFTSGDDIPVGINIGGTLTSPKVSINADQLKEAVAAEVKAQVKEKTTEVVDKVTEKVTEQLQNNEKVQKAAESVKGAIGNLFKKKK